MEPRREPRHYDPLLIYLHSSLDLVPLLSQICRSEWQNLVLKDQLYYTSKQ